MNEALLQTIWQFSIYHPSALVTTQGQPIVVLDPGHRNEDAGPDFLSAKIKIGDLILCGHVEIHIHSSDWVKHKHSADDAYSRIILHVVYKHDMELELPCDTLELQGAIPEPVLYKYNALTLPKRQLPCQNQHTNVSDLIKSHWIERLILERWQNKWHQYWYQVYYEDKNWWRVLWLMTAYHWGFKTNSDAFYQLFKTIPLARFHQMALKDWLDFLYTYSNLPAPQGLSIDIQNGEYWVHKFGLQPLVIPWKFARTRPGNFPSKRLKEIVDWLINFQKQPLSFWLEQPIATIQKHHWRPVGISKAQAQHALINILLPFRYYYGMLMQETLIVDKAIEDLHTLPAEINTITRLYQTHEWQLDTALQSQAYLQLYNQYCQSKACLQCAIGLQLLKPFKTI